MRILIINEFVSMGGTEVQTFREWEYFTQKGHDTYVLTFDNNMPKMLEGHKLNYPIHRSKLNAKIMRLVGSKSFQHDLQKIISRIAPEVIHLNIIYKYYRDVFKCIKGIPTIQTIRDYSAVCPKGTCIFADGKACNGFLHQNCRKCIGFSPKQSLRFLKFRHYNEERKKYISLFFSPSQALANKCGENGLPTSCLNNPFDFTKIIEGAKSFGTRKIYLYYGSVAEHKGVSKLFDAFDSFSTVYDAELWIAGRIDPAFKDRFDQLMKAHYARYLGVLSYQEIMEVYSKIYCVVVPSLWLENYPNTVLEAIANKTLVIGSNRGGIPEMIQNSSFCFDIQNQDSIIDCLRRSAELSPTEYLHVTETAYKRILENNSQDKYYDRLMKIYYNLLSNNCNPE